MSRMLNMAPLALFALAGCQTAASVVTFPVKAVGQGVDWATTSQDEADRNYGRRMREQEEREGRERRKADKDRERQLRENAEAAREASEKDRVRASSTGY